MRQPIPLEQAQALLLEQVAPLPREERVPLLAAVGRVAAETVPAAIFQPPFDRSPLDGYALRRADCAGASPQAPVALRIAMTIAAGDAPEGSVGPGEAARIFTGAPLPPGADCVVAQELVQTADGVVRIPEPPAHANICRRGEDFAPGAALLVAGTRLTAAHIGLLAAQGLAEAAVFPRPRVAVLSTGSELAPAGQPLPYGKIYDGNGALLAARVQEAGGTALLAPAIPDDPAAIAAAIRACADCADLVVTTGGVSVGDRDYLPEVARRLGRRQLFHGVQMRPGSPALAFLLAGAPVLCLSGNPFAAYTTFELLAHPVLRRMAGCAEALPRRVQARLADELHKASPVRRFVRATLIGGAAHLPDGRHASGVLSTLGGCNCLLDIPAGSPPLPAGSEVAAVLL